MGKRRCAAVNCNALEFRSVGYCNRHKKFYPPLEVIIIKKRPIINSNDSDIRYDIDGNKNRISSKSIDELFILLKSAKRYWVVDLGKYEDEFVQYAVNKGELEHWDDSKKIEGKKMKIEDAFEILDGVNPLPASIHINLSYLSTAKSIIIDSHSSFFSALLCAELGNACSI